MADESSAPTTTVETSPMAEETVASLEESAPNNPTDAPQEEEEAKETVAEPSEAAAAEEAAPSASDHKRKMEDLEGEGEMEGVADLGAGEEEEETEAKISEADDAAVDAKRQRVDDGGADGLDGGQDGQKEEATPVGNGQLPYTENTESGHETIENAVEGVSQQDTLPLVGEEDTSRKIEVPNIKVGVLIGKSGETIRQLQNNSGARIQITKDAEADPNSSTRPVELTGTVENINKAEKLIREVIAEADAGGSPALVARGFGASHSGSEVHEMQVPNEKVGLIIGKGGETIKSLQTKSQARIQLIPQHLPMGDLSKERTVRITGYKRQIETAKSMIKEAMNQTPGRPSNLSAGHTQGYRPRGSATLPQWGPRAPPPFQSQMQPNNAYDYGQRGTYPSQGTQYPQQSYGSGYPQQPPPRNLGTGWEQRTAAPTQTSGGYDSYGQGQGMGPQPSNPASAPTSAPVNYYGQQQAAGYGQSNPYSQSGPQQGYGHGYNEPKYDNQAPTQQIYGQQQQPVSSQPGFYSQQGIMTPQTGYTQPPYSKPAAYTGAPQSYGPQRATQPGDPMYQGSAPASYGSGGPTQQLYPYGSTAAASQPGAAYGQNYGPTSGVADGYSQPQVGYSQPGSQIAPSYGQGGQPVQAYTQPAAQSGGYGQYPQGQPAYGEQAVPNNANYGYQGGSGDAVYGNSAPNPGYGAPNPGYGAAAAVGTQPGYGQGVGYVHPSANPSTYDQSMAPQAGYGGHPGGAPVGYAKGVSPQPGGYGSQYDSVPMYGQH